jgi:NAD(P)-dependent dehydrogenase (short-subunit alcohol dehydrogenase family)
VDPVERLLETVVDEPEAEPLRLGRSLRGRCVIVTGGATGLGRAICLEFARQGANVAFNYFSNDGDHDLALEAERTARELTALEVRVFSETLSSTAPPRRSAASTSSSTTPASPATAPSGASRTISGPR